jgi:hypothetical protein
VAAGQLSSQAGPSRLLIPNPQKTSIQHLLEAQQHKKYAQTTPFDDGVSFLLFLNSQKKFNRAYMHSFYNSKSY